jgi:hypothetical protein
MIESFELGDIVRMRKKHPCGSYNWMITRLGVDIGIVCQGCGRRIMMPRSTFVKKAKLIVNQASDESGGGRVS